MQYFVSVNIEFTLKKIKPYVKCFILCNKNDINKKGYKNKIKKRDKELLRAKF